MSVVNNLTGKTLSNRYEILRPLGEGGMGKVYLAKDKRFGKQVVVKVPTMEAGDKDFKDRFMREIASMATLEHPHIVTTVDWGEIEGIPFLVLRYLSGGSLRDRITDAQGYYKPMPLEGLNQWLPQIASALDFIHTKNWVHRDLKPDNILFDEAGNPYLADFGIAKALEGAPMGVKTTMGAFIGTPQYMAPEMHLGKGIGPRADQFGLAVLVYEALAGKIPFAGATPTAIFVEVMQGKARPIHELVPGIPLEKSNALMKGITKEPRDRYGSCVEFANAVTGSMLARGISPAAGSETPSRVVIPGTRMETPSKPEIAGTRIETPSKPEILGIKNETPTKPVIAGTKLETPSKPELIGIRNETPSKPEILGTKLETLSKSEINVTRLEKTPIKPDRKLLGEDYLTKEGQLLAQLCRDLVESGKVTKELFLEARKFFKNNNVTEMPGGMLLEEKIETIVKTGHVSKEISEDIVLLAREILGLGKPEIADARMTKPTIRDTAKIIAQNEKEQESGYVHKIDLPKTMRGELDLNADWNENIKIVLRAGIISGGLGFIFLIVGLTIFSLFKTSGKSPTELIASIEKEMVPSVVSEIEVKTKDAKKELTKSFQQEEEEEAKAKQMELVKLKQEEEAKLKQMELIQLKQEEETKLKQMESVKLKQEEAKFAAIEKEMVLIPDGRFKMGSPASEMGRNSYETIHDTRLTNPYYMGKYEVTQEQWESVMENNPSETKGAKLPVTDVSWNDCKEFIKKLNTKTNAGYRLPTEAEWEYACRAGTTTSYSFGDRITPRYANYDGSKIGNIVAVGSYISNAFGLYDMHGNVWEWCEDCYGDYPLGTATDPKGPASGSSRVLRGGSFVNNGSYARSSNRTDFAPTDRYNFFGFRLARTADLKTKVTSTVVPAPNPTVATSATGNLLVAPFTEAKAKEVQKSVAKSLQKEVEEKEDLGKGTKLEMVLVPAGKFMMGSPASEKGRGYNETQHEVTLTTPFYMGKYEVSQEQWEALMGNNPSDTKGKKLPVTDVSWNDCQEFIKKLNAKTSGSYRLPTEAEWEYACRAGTTTKYSFEDSLPKSNANIDGGSIKAAGSYKPNAFRLYDMHGNVWEWCEDWKADYQAGALTDPKGPATGTSRVLRGGSFNVGLDSKARSFDRTDCTPSFRGNIIGLRLAKTP